MQSNPVCWFEIYVEDMNRAKSFYEGVFATRLMPLDSPGMEMLAFPMPENPMTTPGAMGSLVKMEGCKPGCGGTIVYFSCNDCAHEASLVEKHGGKIFRPKFSIGQWGHIALAFDTEGNMIGLHSQK